MARKRFAAEEIRNLTLLAPDLQEALLFLPSVRDGRAPVTERDLRPVVAESLWSRQRELWGELVAEAANRQAASPDP